MNDLEWKKTSIDIFWAEIAPCEHVVQVYENDEVFMDSLSGFAGGGINAGECVIIIATTAHIKALKERLSSYGIYTGTLVEDDRLMLLDAEEILSKFMIDGWPDEDRFIQTVSSLIEKGLARNRRIRAFGEMVAILWAQGLNGATVQLEHLWNKFCEEHQFSLYCAYPKVGFTENIQESIAHICSCHSKLIRNSDDHLTEIFYADVASRKVG